MNYKIYSIESRKGGVGKTTIALTLAKLLLQKGPVLYLDCDITGTSAALPAMHSAFWKNVTNVIMSEDGKPQNLLEIFLSTYMKGLGGIEELIPTHKINANKVNVIGSSIYEGSSSIVSDTRLLMDEMHSFWLVEYVVGISNLFDEMYPHNEVSIIIDNSPGYVGFNKALHNVMAKMGTDRAKYLMVSSFDEQDLKSCISASNGIRSMVENRIKVAEYYMHLFNNGQIDAVVEELMQKDFELKRFFLEQIENRYPLHDENNNNPKKYLSLVLNKVPEEIRTDGFDYMFNKVLTAEEVSFLYEIANGDEKDNLPKNIISFDKNVVLQFYSSLISEDNQDYDWNRRYMQLFKIINEVHSIIPDPVERAIKIQTTYDSFKNGMNQKKYKRFANTLPVEWQPNYALNKFLDMIATIGTHDMLVGQAIFDDISKDAIMSGIYAKIGDMTKIMGIEEFQQSFFAIITAAAKKLGLNNQRVNRSTRLVSLSVLVSGLHGFMTANFVIGNNFRDFLIAAKNKKRYIVDWKNMLGDQIYLTDDNAIGIETAKIILDTSFKSFYSLFCDAFLRLSEVVSDVNVVIKTCSLFVPYKDVLYMSADIKNYITEVVVEKKEQYDEDKLMRLRQQLTAMSAFETILKKQVLTNWK